ncbi:LOW QUALITY PROTEIN: prolyl 4-hydroxylase subunit alpha-2-like [Sinocyclocheilus rhinocerous]|uniref:LOW QUALITY PROTEIN: prolyl 4-hydroxylase subunit alpha-2-like n=1 Tax=Sinocyclocheilus rhinocerous TaxID=307959 RepID=UPI0007B7F73E|nr:PREDICTED: LOW QUALITY PROTEIN: prolyl 4-hydroxylase subunit alpha-2-like [Sinocyclocheilus rhinocerous]
MYDDPEEIMRVPMAAYKLLRQLRNDLIHIVENNQPSLQCEEHHDELKAMIPLLEDLDGAASGLIRLQEIYKLYPEDITNGTSLNADKAHHVGWVAYNERKFQHAFLWFLYSLNTSKEYPSTMEEELFNYLYSSAYYFGSLPRILHPAASKS